MKGIAIILWLFTLSITAMAQDNVQFGLKAGISSSNLNSNIESATISSRQSFYAGGIALFPVSKSFSIQSEFLYSGEGTKTNVIEMELNYLRVPILLQYKHNSGFHVEAGPQLGFLVNHKVTLIDQEEEVEADKQLGKASTTIAIGCGYRLKNGLGLDIRYARGIDNPIAAQNAKLVVISGGLSYTF
ncbi:MAG: porin family protein [Pseudobacter sp.]|uniref:porin family protein n=1 Tax=Pseudobacter sp. TaxID=2045420 RepID=UPI003F80EF34